MSNNSPLKLKIDGKTTFYKLKYYICGLWYFDPNVKWNKRFSR